MNEIEFVRGDTPTLAVPIKYKSGEVIPMEDIDAIFLTCRRNPDKSYKVLFEKKKEDFTLEDNKYKVRLKPEDTQELTYSDGTFHFDIEVTLTNGARKTRNYELSLEKDCTIHGGDESGE